MASGGGATSRYQPPPPRFIPGKKTGTWMHLNKEASHSVVPPQKADPEEHDESLPHVLRHYGRYGTICQHFDGHGIVEGVYKAIHKQAASIGPAVRLPHTIIYRGSTMASWYFTSVQDGLVKKKSRRHRVPERVLEAFMKAAQRNRASEIVASYSYFPPGGDDEPSKMVVEYFDARGLEQFLFHRNTDKHGGVLQAPTIRARWTPHLLQLESRVNLNSLADSRVGRQARGATFDGPESASELRVFRGDAASPRPAPLSSKPRRTPPRPTRNAITRICDAVASAVVATRPKAIVTKMTLDVKVDAADRLWVLSGSALHIGYLEKRVQSGMYVACAQCLRLTERPRFKPGASLPRTMTMYAVARRGREGGAPPPGGSGGSGGSGEESGGAEEEGEESAPSDADEEPEAGAGADEPQSLPPILRPSATPPTPSSAAPPPPLAQPAPPSGAPPGRSPRQREPKKQRTGVEESGQGEWPPPPRVTAASALLSPRLPPFVPAGRRPRPLVHRGRREGAGFGLAPFPSGSQTARSYARYEPEAAGDEAEGGTGAHVEGGGAPPPRSFDRALRKLGLSQGTLSDPAAPPEPGRPARRRVPMRTEVAPEEPHTHTAWGPGGGGGGADENQAPGAPAGEGRGAGPATERKLGAQQMSDTSAFRDLDPGLLRGPQP
eukprot:tig00021037_g17483.t1